MKKVATIFLIAIAVASCNGNVSTEKDFSDSMPNEMIPDTSMQPATDTTQMNRIADSMPLSPR